MKGRRTRARRKPNRVSIRVARGRGRSLSHGVQVTARRFMKRLGLQGSELSISLVGDAAIRRLNRTWRGKDRATDVLSFPLGEMPPAMPGLTQLGDVVISLDTARRRARKNGRAVSREVNLYLAHGLLHLLGYDHHTRSQAARMARLEQTLLGQPGMV